MGSRLGQRVIHLPNLPIKLLQPSPPSDYIREIALKTIPSASKIEIRRYLESLYGLDVAEVRTLNMEGKKIKRGHFLAAKPDYKKAYVTLRTPLFLTPDLSPVKIILDDRERIAAAAKATAPADLFVVDGEDGRNEQKHWLDDQTTSGERCRLGMSISALKLSLLAVAWTQESRGVMDASRGMKKGDKIRQLLGVLENLCLLCHHTK